MKRSTLVLAALTLAFGAQSIRVLLPAMLTYIGEGPVSPWVFALYAYGPYILALAAPLLARWLRPRGALRVAGSGLILFRLVEQVSTTNALDLWAAMGATVCFLWLLPLLFGRARADGEEGMQTLVLGLLLGLSLDTALHGLTGTLDLNWIPGVSPLLAVSALVMLFGWALWRVTCDEVQLGDEGFLASLPLIGLGLLLFVEWQILQNQGWVASLTGWPPGLALSWILLGNVAALLAAAYALTNLRLRSRGWWPLVPGCALTLALAFADVPGWTFAAGVLAGLVSAGLLLAAIVAEAPQPSLRAGPARSFISIWIGELLFVSFLFTYYISFIVRLPPFPRSALAPVAGVGLTVCAVAATRRRPRAPLPQAPDWIPARLGALLLLAPLFVVVTAAWRAPRPVLAQGYPVRVMTYNIHSGYGEDGRQDEDELVQAIEGAGTDVVALQELSRGWVVSGGTDQLALLADRLNMPYAAMGASTDPVFGDAILSRYPILASGDGDVPRFDTLIPRGYVWALLDLGGGAKLLVITTHLEPSGPTTVRITQAASLLKAWAARPQTVILGDMNSVAGSPQMHVLLDAGLVDTWAEVGHGDRPEVDWIFHTPDLIARDVETVDSPASDHFAVVATIAPAP